MQARKTIGATGRGGAAGLALLLLAVGAGAGPTPGGHGPLPVRGAKMVTLSGGVGGTWAQAAPETDGACPVSGNGDVAPLGPVQVAGSIHAPAPGGHGRMTGTVTLTGAHGALTLALSGTMPPAPSGVSAGVPSPGPAAAPSALAYTVTGATGDYRGRREAGTAHLALTPQRRPPHIPGRMTPQFIVAPQFRLTFGGPPNL